MYIRNMRITKKRLKKLIKNKNQSRRKYKKRKRKRKKIKKRNTLRKNKKINLKNKSLRNFKGGSNEILPILFSTINKQNGERKTNTFSFKLCSVQLGEQEAPKILEIKSASGATITDSEFYTFSEENFIFKFDLLEKYKKNPYFAYLNDLLLFCHNIFTTKMQEERKKTGIDLKNNPLLQDILSKNNVQLMNELILKDKNDMNKYLDEKRKLLSFFNHKYKWEKVFVFENKKGEQEEIPRYKYIWTGCKNKRFCPQDKTDFSYPSIPDTYENWITEPIIEEGDLANVLIVPDEKIKYDTAMRVKKEAEEEFKRIREERVKQEKEAAEKMKQEMIVKEKLEKEKKEERDKLIEITGEPAKYYSVQLFQHDAFMVAIQEEINRLNQLIQEQENKLGRKITTKDEYQKAKTIPPPPPLPSSESQQGQTGQKTDEPTIPSPPTIPPPQLQEVQKTDQSTDEPNIPPPPQDPPPQLQEVQQIDQSTDEPNIPPPPQDPPPQDGQQTDQTTGVTQEQLRKNMELEVPSSDDDSDFSSSDEEESSSDDEESSSDDEESSSDDEESSSDDQESGVDEGQKQYVDSQSGDIVLDEKNKKYFDNWIGKADMVGNLDDEPFYNKKDSTGMFGRTRGFPPMYEINNIFAVGVLDTSKFHNWIKETVKKGFAGDKKYQQIIKPRWVGDPIVNERLVYEMALFQPEHWKLEKTQVYGPTIESKTINFGVGTKKEKKLNYEVFMLNLTSRYNGREGWKTVNVVLLTTTPKLSITKNIADKLKKEIPEIIIAKFLKKMSRDTKYAFLDTTRMDDESYTFFVKKDNVPVGFHTELSRVNDDPALHTHYNIGDIFNKWKPVIRAINNLKKTYLEILDPGAEPGSRGIIKINDIVTKKLQTTLNDSIDELNTVSDLLDLINKEWMEGLGDEIQQVVEDFAQLEYKKMLFGHEERYKTTARTGTINATKVYKQEYLLEGNEGKTGSELFRSYFEAEKTKLEGMLEPIKSKDIKEHAKEINEKMYPGYELKDYMKIQPLQENLEEKNDSSSDEESDSEAIREEEVTQEVDNVDETQVIKPDQTTTVSINELIRTIGKDIPNVDEDEIDKLLNDELGINTENITNVKNEEESINKVITELKAKPNAVLKETTIQELKKITQEIKDYSDRQKLLRSGEQPVMAMRSSISNAIWLRLRDTYNLNGVYRKNDGEVKELMKGIDKDELLQLSDIRSSGQGRVDNEKDKTMVMKIAKILLNEQGINIDSDSEQSDGDESVSEDGDSGESGSEDGDDLANDPTAANEGANIDPRMTSDGRPRDDSEQKEDTDINPLSEEDKRKTEEINRERAEAGSGTGTSDSGTGTSDSGTGRGPVDPVPSAPLPPGKIKEYPDQNRWLHLFIQGKRVDPDTGELYQPDFKITKSPADNTSQWVRRMASSLRGGKRRRKTKKKKRKTKSKKKKKRKTKSKKKSTLKK
jgi:hypothetical protein